MALIHKLLVFTAVWNCFVTLVFCDGENEKSISAAASIVEVFFFFFPLKRRRNLKCYLFYGSP